VKDPDIAFLNFEGNYGTRTKTHSNYRFCWP